MSARCGYIAILGAPNAGKSTLTNRLTGAKISIVSPKVQTTRFRVRAIAMEGESQLIFVDTPGIFRAGKTFERAMVEEAWAGLADADALLLLVDAKKGLDEETHFIIERLRESALPKAIVLNKIDLVDKPQLMKLAQACAAHGFEHIFMISALKSDGIDDIKRWLAGQVPQGPWLYPEDHLTDLPMRLLASEVTREKLFLLLRQELPYSLMVETEQWQERPNGTVAISQVILVEREGQKTIVIGKGGETLKKVGTMARKDLERQLERKVHLTLFVKVSPEWKRKGVMPQ